MPPIDASIPLQVKQPEFLSPAQMIQLRNLARQGQLQELQLAEATRSQQIRNQMLQITGNAANKDPQTGMLNPQGLQQLSGVDPQSYFGAAQDSRVALSQLSAQKMRDQEFQMRMGDEQRKEKERIANQSVSAYDLALE